MKNKIVVKWPRKGEVMKLYKFVIVACMLLLTACQAKQALPESTADDTEMAASEAFIQEETGIGEKNIADETAPDIIGSSAAAADTVTTEPEGDHGGKNVAGTWHINAQKTEEANELSLQGEFGTGIQLGNEMMLSENGDFSFYVSIGQGGKGTWKIEENTITADFTTYEPEVREEQLTMVTETGEGGELLIKMTYTDGYLLFWSRQGGETAASKEAGGQVEK